MDAPQSAKVEESESNAAAMITNDILQVFKVLIQSYDKNLIGLKQQQLDTVMYFARDIYWKKRETHNTDLETRKLIFSKTKANPCNIEDNSLHNFAKSFCISTR